MIDSRLQNCVDESRMAAEANREKLPPTWVETEQLHCLMVFDTESKQFVGSGCYVVGPCPRQERSPNSNP